MGCNFPAYNPNMNKEDEAIWVLNNKFRVQDVWNAIRDSFPVVSWYELVWHKDYIPRCSMILWLVFHDRLRTKDRLLKWGVVDNSTCVLCGFNEETRDHLFFCCSFSAMVWNAVLMNMDVAYQCTSWQAHMDKALHLFKGVQLQARVGQIAFAATVYCIWQERNMRVFSGRFRTVDVIVHDIENYVRAKTYKWQVN